LPADGMKSRFALVVATLLATLVVLALAGVAYIHSGRYNVAATRPHSALSTWVLETAQKNSVQAHAQRVDGPPASTASAADTLQHAMGHYASTCVVCHGAPGVERGEIGKGITPTPPDLAHAAREWSEKELFWIVKHGIKFAGMPAFGPTHTDEELWSLVALLERLPRMPPAEYRELSAQAQAPGQGSGGSHAHGHGHAHGS
jgi:mono/diheme cytochrome c family protein